MVGWEKVDGDDMANKWRAEKPEKFHVEKQGWSEAALLHQEQGRLARWVAMDGKKEAMRKVISRLSDVE